MNFNSRERSTFLRCSGFFKACGGWHTWAAIGIGGASLIGGVVSGIGSASAANSANQANIANTNATNALNYQMFQQSRGANGNALLPLYMGGDEQQMGTDAYNSFQSLLGMSNSITPQLNSAVASTGPGFASSLNSILGMYNGSNLRQQLGFNQPLYNANIQQAQTAGQGGINVAAANMNGINTGLAATIARLNASNQANGFFGNSTFANNRMLDATMAAHQQAATGMAQAQANYSTGVGAANLGNIQNTTGLQMTNLANSTNTSPLSGFMQSYGGALSTPTQMYAQNVAAAQSPMNFFKMPVQSFTTQNMPYQSPSINAGQIIGGAISSAGQGAGMGMMLNGMNQAPAQSNPSQIMSYQAPANPFSTPLQMSDMTPMYGDGSAYPSPYTTGSSMFAPSTYGFPQY